MPNEQQHIQWALHNIDVITYLSKETRYCDWTATVSFYTALHVIEAVFYRMSGSCRHGICHENRMKLLKTTKRFEKIYRHYRNLYSASRIARYVQDASGDTVFFADYMPHERVISDLIQHDLRHVLLSAAKVGKFKKELTENLHKAVNKLPK